MAVKPCRLGLCVVGAAVAAAAAEAAAAAVANQPAMAIWLASHGIEKGRQNMGRIRGWGL